MNRADCTAVEFAGYCFIVALAAELGGVALIVCEAVRMRRLLDRWNRLNPRNNAGGSHRQIMLVNRVMQILFTARIRVTTAVALLTIGIVAGTVGNFASL
jgi:hypothetical protein